MQIAVSKIYWLYGFCMYRHSCRWFTMYYNWGRVTYTLVLQADCPSPTCRYCVSLEWKLWP